ncbi:MAG TPA: hypothetical protein VMF52_03555 [Steroidobacteraceae bacterium]|nr:hypothetical protein [Steroidobacteraceae bacterium]
MSDGFWFRSTLFEIEPGEDGEINPGIYGRQLASWLRHKLLAAGYDIEDVINEDWGRCLMCQRSPFALWVGVGSVGDGDADTGAAPPADEIVWHCFAVTEGGLRMRFFGRKSEIDTAREALDAALKSILLAEPRILIVPEP